MPKKRMICESLLYSEDFNSLTIAEQNIYFRLLSIADDLGVTPANGYALNKILNPPEGTDVMKSLKKFDQKLGHIFTYGDKQYFCFNPITFWEIQKGVVSKRTRSEYLLISPSEFFSKKFLEDSGISRKFPEILARLKDKVYSMKIKGLREEGGMGGEKARPSNIEEVSVYFAELGVNESFKHAQDFLDHYEACGWKMNGGKDIKDWKAAVRNWKKRIKDFTGATIVSLTPEQKRRADIESEYQEATKRQIG